MRNLIRAAVAALLILALSGCALVKVNNDRVILARVGEENITLTDYLPFAVSYFNSSGISPVDTSQADYISSIEDEVLNYLIDSKIYEIKTREYGYDQEDPADRDEARQFIDDYFAQQREIREDAYRTEYPNATDEEVQADVEEYIAAYFSETTTMDSYYQQRFDELHADKLYRETTKDVQLEDSELQATYEEYLAIDKENYENDRDAYASTIADGSISLYHPDGIQYVQHILIAIPQDMAEQINTLRQDGSELEADALLRAELDKIQARADEVLALVEAGGDFKELMDEYGEDPGMTQEPDRSLGYMVYPDHPLWADAFTAGAIALTEDGQTSPLVVTDNGYHIIKRVSSIAPGATPLDEVRESLGEEVLAAKQDEVFTQQLAQWREELNVKIWKNRIDYSSVVR